MAERRGVTTGQYDGATRRGDATRRPHGARSHRSRVDRYQSESRIAISGAGAPPQPAAGAGGGPREAPPGGGAGPPARPPAAPEPSATAASLDGIGQDGAPDIAILLSDW